MRIDIRGDNVTLSAHMYKVIEDRTRLALARLGSQTRASIVIGDVNGPRKGVDRTCAVKVLLAGGGEVHVEASDEIVPAAVDRALDRAARAAARLIERRREFRRDTIRRDSTESRYY